MRDNKTSQPAQEYEANIEKTMPYYRFFHTDTLALVRHALAGEPGNWLDTGCGTGILAEKARAVFQDTRFVLADPSGAMLDIAREKFPGDGVCEYVQAPSEELECPSGRFDVITAILAHHYLDADNRRKATANCFRMLGSGGVYVTFESIRPATRQGLQIGLDRWKANQIDNGKSVEAAQKHISRYGVEFFPITIDEHIALLRAVGFSTVELFWASNMQAGFYAIKG
ncbi:MAG: class I SAM-dependent methyltransferase [Negativicutes bacterium]|nr:class I SAM-dependent methyltransferase [Negativicutes bacterium]